MTTTTTSAFDDAYAKTLGFEGGLSDRREDRGGRTMRGVTQTTYDAWRRSRGLPAQPVDLISDEEERALLHDEFWAPCHCDALPPHLAALVFDMAVNSGPWNAKLTLQRAARATADGAIGPATIRAVEATPDIALRFLKQRAGFITEDLQAHPADIANLHGWINRLLDQAAEVNHD